MIEKSTWMEFLVDAMQAVKDSGPIIAYAPNLESFQVQFDPGYGDLEGPPILAWTKDRVYFPVAYDGAEWIDSAPRNPTESGQCHVLGRRVA